ncbi:hypothetical protein CIK77_15840 [Microbacterium sp. JB110]|nr:hypothetical protein CIK77_15840 [Microbacterium sp. JB110]SJM45799.1 hypothetical protein CZ774_02295 [Frigoribacterium sp. JB110]
MEHRAAPTGESAPRDGSGADLAQLDSVMEHIRAHGGVSAAGRMADPVARWLRLRRATVAVSFGAAGLGVFALAVGIALRETGAWALLILIGGFLIVCGVIAGGAVSITTRLWNDRLRAEREPVVIDRTGIVVRGIGPIPWGWVAPPERRRIRVKNDIGGVCAVMPLTEQGSELVGRQQGWWQMRVGPRPYLRFRVPCLMLPGIEGLTEDETMQVFAFAHQRFAS